MSASEQSSRSSSPTSSATSCSEKKTCDCVPIVYKYENDRPPRALKRFPAGGGAWLDNMYTVNQMARQSNPEYLAKKRDQWSEKREVYNAQRRARRQEALQDLKDQGFPIYEDDKGVLHMDIQRGRKCVPEAAHVVPKTMIQPVGIEEVILLQDPDFLRNVADTVPVPEKGDNLFDLQGYLGVKELIIVKNALKWGMFFHSSWDELSKKAREGYVGNARRAMKNDLMDYVAQNKALAEKYFWYDPKEDFWVRKLEKEEVEQEEGDVEEGVAELAEEQDLVEEEKGKPGPAEEEEEGEPPVDKVPANRQRTGEKGGAKVPTKVFTRNPLRIVQFMVEANIDPWKIVLGTCETSQANNKASALASCCYAYLRNMYGQKEHKGINSALFNRVLQWSFIFERYTKVARKNTQDRHAAQLTSPEKQANTEKWDVWQARALAYLKNYFVISPNGDKVTIKNKAEGYRPYFELPRPHQMRERITKLDDGKVNKYRPDLLPWWLPSYNQVRAEEGSDDRPNLRELRDCVMLAVYSYLAPIRLDWATVEIMEKDQFDKYLVDKAAAEKVQEAQVEGQVVKFKRGAAKRNVIVVDSIASPKAITGVWFGKMKNIKSFRDTPVPKFITQEDLKMPRFAYNVILAFLQERTRLRYTSPCLFPYSTYKSDELSKAEVIDDAGARRGKLHYNCFTNPAFGERIADLAHLLTGKNFTETLFRRSYITWFWNQPGNNPLIENDWKRLLPSVHQNSKTTNLGYIKNQQKWDEQVVIKEELWKKENGQVRVPAAVTEQLRRQVALEQEGMWEGADNFNPEVDKDDVIDLRKTRDDLQRAMQEVTQVRAEQQENLQKVQNAIRRSARLAGGGVEIQVQPKPKAAEPNPQPQQPEPPAPKPKKPKKIEPPPPVKAAAAPAAPAKKVPAPKIKKVLAAPEEDADPYKRAYRPRFVKKPST